MAAVPVMFPPLTIDNGCFEVVATTDDMHLGGEYFDQRVRQHFMKIFLKKHGKDMSKDKRALSSTHQGCVETEALHNVVNLSEKLTRARFEEFNTFALMSGVDIGYKTFGVGARLQTEASWQAAWQYGIERVGTECDMC